MTEGPVQEGRASAELKALQADLARCSSQACFISAADGATRQVVYCDHFATGVTVPSIEHFLEENVLPYNANAHSATSSAFCARRAAALLAESRAIIRTAVRASEDDAVLFCGHGATAAVNKLVRVLAARAERESRRLLVIVGPQEHHSNILPWRELPETVLRDVVYVSEYEKLPVVLAQWSSRAEEEKLTLVGAFSAVSNVTGEIIDAQNITKTLHKFGALAVWDCTAAAPYIALDMHPVTDADASIDALFFSGHKFVGGVGTPGVLVARCSLFDSTHPESSGGGTVLFVDADQHVFHSTVEQREEGGSHDLAGIVRLGLCIQIRENIGTDIIAQRNARLCQLVDDYKWDNQTIIRFPQSSRDCAGGRIPVLSFILWNKQTQRFLHHDFVCALLNDLFGIQARGGCLCAAPYVWQLLGIDKNTIVKFRDALVRAKKALGDIISRERDRNDLGVEVYRPGIVRVSLHWTMDDELARFVLDAVNFVAQRGWELLPAYEFVKQTGQWRYRQQWKAAEDANRVWLGRFSLTGTDSAVDKTKSEPLSRDECLQRAMEKCTSCAKDLRSRHIRVTEFSDGDIVTLEGCDLTELRWFATPYDGAQCILKDSKLEPHAPLFCAARLEKAHSSVPVETQTVSSSCEANSEEEPFFTGYDSEEDDDKGKNWHFVTPPRKLFKEMLDGINMFQMIKEGDRVLACISGGKDSLSMLHMLACYQQKCAHSDPPLHFELGAATVDPQEPSFHPQPLTDYMASLGVPYTLKSQAVMACARRVNPDSICSFCSRVKRGLLYSVARQSGYNVLALGQHLDDACESFLMSAFRNGFLRTMKANYTVTEGDLRVIRPLM